MINETFAVPEHGPIRVGLGSLTLGMSAALGRIFGARIIKRSVPWRPPGAVPPKIRQHPGPSGLRWGHAERGEEGDTSTARRVFIGHGRSRVWRDLRDLLDLRLGLQWDEFNREATPGRSTQSRLMEMLDNCCFAFIVMTAEDAQADGSRHPRLNVVHELGLFQGRLGFLRAIVLLEDGCPEFSNVAGTTQIRFPAGNIEAQSEEIRRVLERERILKPAASR